MKIGIDIGGSHIGIGLINKAGTIILKKEKDLVAELEKESYNEKLVTTIVELINEILEEANISIKEIELIGMAVPRNSIRYTYSKSRKFTYKKL